MGMIDNSLVRRVIVEKISFPFPLLGPIIAWNAGVTSPNSLATDVSVGCASHDMVQNPSKFALSSFGPDPFSLP